jgi:hypothetical protein
MYLNNIRKLLLKMDIIINNNEIIKNYIDIYNFLYKEDYKPISLKKFNKYKKNHQLYYLLTEEEEIFLLDKLK